MPLKTRPLARGVLLLQNAAVMEFVAADDAGERAYRDFVFVVVPRRIQADSSRLRKQHQRLAADRNAILDDFRNRQSGEGSHWAPNRMWKGTEHTRFYGIVT